MQISFVHVRGAGLLAEGLRISPSSLHFIYERYIVNSIMVIGWRRLALAFSLQRKLQGLRIISER